MTRTAIKQTCSIGFIALATIGLQGCIAAAFPIAAGGLIGERSISGRSDAAEPEAVVEVAGVDAPEQVINSDLAPVNAQPAIASPPASSVSADFNAAFTEANLAPNSASTGVASTVLAPPSSQSVASEPEPVPETVLEPAPTTIPAPAPVAQVTRTLPTPVPSAREPFGPSGINQLLSYANNRQIGSEEEPDAAMLSDRVALEPVKAKCGGVSPTVLIDLDPEGALFDSTTASRPPSGLARGLARLRENGVGVAWISGNGIDKLDAIKRSLTYSGLDLNNEDRVLLVRSSDDRKQTLREELAQISCLIAIAGDTRSDFDELYDYLKNPADAKSLEPLIGDGWFLIPQPLL